MHSIVICKPRPGITSGVCLVQHPDNLPLVELWGLLVGQLGEVQYIIKDIAIPMIYDVATSPFEVVKMERYILEQAVGGESGSSSGDDGLCG